MSKRIDYKIEKYSFDTAEKSLRLMHQWTVLATECRQQQAGA